MTCSIVSCRSSGERASPWSLVSISSTSRWSTMSSAMMSSSAWCSGGMSTPCRCRGSGGLQSLPQPAQGLADETGHLHLGDADVVGDLLLRPALEEAQGQDPAVARRQPLEQRPDGQDVLDLAEHRVEVAEGVADG